MNSYTKIFKEFMSILLLFMLLSTAGLSEKVDSKDKKADDISTISADISTSPIAADDSSTPENIDTIDSEADDIGTISADVSSAPIDADDANTLEDIDTTDSEADDIGTTSADVSSTPTNADAIASENIDAADKEHGNQNPGIMPSNSKPGGLSYGEWNAEWWQWAVSIPWDENHPLFDNSPSPSTVSNEGLPGYDVLFLGSTFGDATDINRMITVSPGTKIFIPILNTANFGLVEGPNGEYVRSNETEEDLQTNLIGTINSIEIDGVSVENPEQYVSPSGLFTTGPFPEENIFGVDIEENTTANTVADGYYLMLTPLPPGEHTISFTTSDGFLQDVTYTINVDPGYDKAAAQKGNGLE